MKINLLGRTCDNCKHLGYVKDNYTRDFVCKWALNFDYKTYRYDNEFAKKCEKFEEAK